MRQPWEDNAALAVKMVAGISLITGILIAVPLALVVRNRASELVLRKLKQYDLSEIVLSRKYPHLLRSMKLQNVGLFQASLDEPISMAIGGSKNGVILSKQILNILEEDEIESVVAHELAHIGRGDHTIKMIAAAYRLLIPFDLTIRLTEAALHRESEFVADETAAYVTRKPLSLASALIKIHEALPKRLPKYLAALSVASGEKGIFSKHPPLEIRVKRLIKIADVMNGLQTIPAKSL